MPNASSIVDVPPSGSYGSPLARFPVFYTCYGGLLFRKFRFAKPCPLHSPLSISPLRVRLKARLAHWYRFRRVMADLDFRIIKVEVLSFKTSISRNHAHCILHSRFPPFGFIWKPVGSIRRILHELWRIRAGISFHNVVSKQRAM